MKPPNGIYVFTDTVLLSFDTARVCQPQDVTLHLKAGSYPVISPENITFPKHFLSLEQRLVRRARRGCQFNHRIKHVSFVGRFDIYTLQFKSDGVTRRQTIEGPHPGNWFGVAFITWTDPNNERIEQQGNERQTTFCSFNAMRRTIIQCY